MTVFSGQEVASKVAKCGVKQVKIWMRPPRTALGGGPEPAGTCRNPFLLPTGFKSLPFDYATQC